MAFNWLNSFVENHQTKPALFLYNIVLNGCAKMGSNVSVDYCLELMEHEMVGKSEITYWELLKVAVQQQNVSAVHEIWKDCAKHYSPNIVTLRKFIWSFSILGDLESAFIALKHMVALALRGSVSVRLSAEGRYHSNLDIPIPFATKKHKEISRPMDIKSSPRTEEVVVGNCTDILSMLRCHIKHNKVKIKWHSMERAFSGTLDSGCATDADERYSCLQPFATPSDASGIDNARIAIKMEEHADLNLENIKFRYGKSSSLKLLQSSPIMKILRWSFGDLIHACAASRNFELAERLFTEMHELGLQASAYTFDGFVKAVISTKGVIEGMKVLNAMRKRNLKPLDSTLATLSVGYSRCLELDFAEALLGQISKGNPKLINAFNDLLASCDFMDQPERALRVLSKMKDLKVQFNRRTYELMFSLFGNVNTPYEEADVLSKAQAAKRIQAIEMSMIENGVQHNFISMKNLVTMALTFLPYSSESLRSEGMIEMLFQYLHMAEKQFCVRNMYSMMSLYDTVLNTLVDAKEIVLADEDFDRAFDLLDQSMSEGIEPDAVLFNTILKAAHREGRIDIIELCIERMHREKIQPDPQTCSCVLSSYLNRGFHSTAIEALRVLSLRMISEDENVLQECKSEFEGLVHSEDSDGEVHIIEIFKDSREHIAAALLNLRWCAITGYELSWSPEESLMDEKALLSVIVFKEKRLVKNARA
ncbi:Pentatricopeptide repeat-containing protein [Acorus calamus]|uniref:Pentatricopeptide repeat-containing protein n=1 Tax=Acorus calamus TaxID=4465 RepID=A0AAV9ES28_ACOCL|nr:Pentatricopeptide repeat-containing protein [Acorus calamus]